MYTEVMKVVKTEDSLESLDVDKNMEVKKEYDQLVASHGQLSAPEESKTELESKLLDEALREALRRSQTSSSTDGMPGTHDQLKHENTTFGCTLCLEDFPCEEEYNAHMDMHFQISDADTSCVTSQVCEAGAAVSSGWHSGLIELKHAVQSLDDCHPSTDLASPSVPCLAAPLATKEDLPDKTYNNKLDIKLFAHCVVKLYDVLRKPDKLRTSTKSHCETSASDVTGAQKKLMKSYTSQCETHRLCNDNKLQFSKSAVNSLHARNAKRFTCDVCRTTFKQNKFLVQHIKTHTERKMFTCELCQYQSVFKGNVSRHMQTHSRKKPYSCEICEYKSARNCHLQQHMRTHTGERPYSCDICGHASAHKYRLVIHMRSHTGEKRYSCNLCQFKSNRKFNLVQHMRTHTGEKPFSCNFCKYASVRSSHLVQHMRTHTGERRL
ncbi:zinc finger protein 37 isoform X3 [Bicyclus anynana]|uniref:Zinc finger protein 37 isoform X3 n=1 Tax=Bicyclus anynana TaxID=110368 RepID=A0ABM3M3C5_BICAN|nr:zinc finger protein 37 isoform X3 [Bicyclus anynana]